MNPSFLVLALAWPSPAGAQGGPPKEPPSILVTRKGETQWVLNAMAIRGAGPVESRLKLLGQALAELEKDNAFLGDFRRVDREHRIAALKAYLEHFFKKENNWIGANAIVLDYEGRLWNLFSTADGKYGTEETGQFEKLWSGEKELEGPKGKPKPQAAGLAIYYRPLDRKAAQPLLQLIGGDQRERLMGGSPEMKGNPLTGYTIRSRNKIVRERFDGNEWTDGRIVGETEGRTEESPGAIEIIADEAFSFLGGAAMTVVSPLASVVWGGGVVGKKAVSCDRVGRYDLVDEMSRDQQGIGSCHAFGSVGALESGMRRQYSKRIKLSELDLFAGIRFKDPDFYKHQDIGGACKQDLEEGWSAEKDLKYAIEKGVASLKSLPYAEALDYQVKKPFGKPTPCEKDPGSGECKKDRELKKAIEAIGTKTKSKAVEESRAVVRDALKGFEVVPKTYDAGSAGLEQAYDIATFLCAGIPVVVSMELVGLEAWGIGPGEMHARHAFLVSGFSQKDEGIVLTTRNSWGTGSVSLPSSNPDIPQKHLSRIYRMAALLAPRDLKRPHKITEELSKKLEALEKDSK